MAEFPAMPFYTDAYLADTTHLSAQEHGAYMLLLMVAWRTADTTLPDDDILLARYAKVDPRTWRKIKPTVMAFWDLSDGFWSQKKQQKVKHLVSKRVEAKRANGMKGGRPKSLKNNETGEATGLLNETEPKLTKTKTKPSYEGKKEEPNGSSKSRGSRLPENWQPDREFARTEGLPEGQIDREAEKFRDHWRAQSGAKGVKKDWEATWKNWVRNAVDGFGRREKPRIAANIGPTFADKHGNLPGDPWYGVDY